MEQTIASPWSGPTPQPADASDATVRTAVRLVRGAIGLVVRALVFLLPSLLLARPGSHAGSRALGVLSRGLLAALGVEVRVRGRMPLGPAILVANHLGYLDPAALVACLPACGVAKHEVRHWPLFGPLLDRAGALWYRRGDVNSGARVLRRALRSLRAGVPVLCFPEGTTTDGTCVLPFRRGIFGLARHARVPVVPVIVQTECAHVPWIGDDAFVPHLLRLAARPRTVLTLTFDLPIWPSCESNADRLALMAHDRIAARIVRPDHRRAA